jgi:hypothetical protein
MAGRMENAADEINKAALLNPNYLAGKGDPWHDAGAAGKGRWKWVIGCDFWRARIRPNCRWRIAHSYPDGPVRSTLQALISDLWQPATAREIS